MSQASADPARPERVLDEVLARPEFRAYVEAREPSAGENWLFRLLDFRFGTPDWLDSLLALAFLGLAAFVLAILLRGARRGRGQAVETWGEVGGANVRARRPARE